MRRGLMVVASPNAERLIDVCLIIIAPYGRGMFTPRRRIIFGNYSPCKSATARYVPDVSAFSGGVFTVSANTRDYLHAPRAPRYFFSPIFPCERSSIPGIATGLILARARARAERPIRHSEIVEADIAGAHERSRGFVIPRSA